MLWSLPLLSLLAGAVLGVAFRRGGAVRGALGGVAVAVVAATAGIAGWAVSARPAAALDWGAGLALTLRTDHPAVVVMALLVPLVALPVVAYAAAHEDARGLGRLVGGLVAFVGAMELLVLAGDLLTLLIGWELVGALSWGLIAHRWWEPGTPGAAAHAFNATRFGDLGLFLAAAAAISVTGSASYADLAAVDGAASHVVAGGVLLAAAAKSAQGPFAPWLFSAMAGPTPVSALLHAATMVAAGGYLLVRLAPALQPVGWFGPAVVTVGLATALAAGVVAVLQPRAKRLLAASTSAQYGLVLVAVGAGSAAAGLAHLVAHAVAKAPLFLAAGLAISAAGSHTLGGMRLGRTLPTVAWLALPASLALAAVPPLGAAWTKEAVTAAAGERAAWLAVAVAVAGGLSAAYAARFQALAYGPGPERVPARRPGGVEPVAIGSLAVATVALSGVWLPGGRALAEAVAGGILPEAPPWERVVSLAGITAGLAGALVAWRRGRLVAGPVAARAAETWLGLVPATRRLAVDPALALAASLARFDDRVVDAGVRGAAAVGRALSSLLTRLTEPRIDRVVRRLATLAQAAAGRSSRADDGAVDGTVRAIAGGAWKLGGRSRELQTGLSHHYYVLVAAGAAALVLAAVVWG